MTNTVKVLIVAVLLALLSGLLWQAGQRGAWKERVKDLEAQVDSTNTLLEGYTRDSLTWKQERDSLGGIARLRASQARVRLSQLDSLKKVQAQNDSVLEVLRSGVEEDSLTTPVRDLLKAERENALRASQSLVLAEGVIVEQGGQIEALEAVEERLLRRVESLETLRSRLQAERDSSRALNKPPSLLNLVFELGAGPGCVVGLGGRTTCGVSVQVTVVRFQIPLFP